MAKSKTRGGAKAHRKRINARNSHLASIQRKMKEEYTAEMKKRFDEYNKTLTADTENSDMVVDEQPLNIKL